MIQINQIGIATDGPANTGLLDQFEAPRFELSLGELTRKP